MTILHYDPMMAGDIPILCEDGLTIYVNRIGYELFYRLGEGKFRERFGGYTNGYGRDFRGPSRDDGLYQEGPGRGYRQSA